jgi:hypothetical protein
MDVIIIVTAQNCGGCISMRGKTGELLPDNDDKSPRTIPGGDRWNSKFFRLLLTGGKDDGVQRFRVFELHFPDRFNLNYSNIDAFTEIGLFINDKAYVERKIYGNDKGKLKEIREIDRKQKTVNYINSNLVNFVKTKVPAVNYSDYLQAVPGWIFIDGNTFDDAVANPSNFYSLSVGHDTSLQNGKYVNIFKPNKKEGVIAMASKIVNKEISLKPSTSSSSSSVSTSSAEEKGEEMPVVDICRRIKMVPLSRE